MFRWMLEMCLNAWKEEMICVCRVGYVWVRECVSLSVCKCARAYVCLHFYHLNNDLTRPLKASLNLIFFPISFCKISHLKTEILFQQTSTKTPTLSLENIARRGCTNSDVVVFTSDLLSGCVVCFTQYFVAIKCIF